MREKFFANLSLIAMAIASLGPAALVTSRFRELYAGNTEIVFVTAIALLVSYLAAAQIEGHPWPFRLVLFEWSCFSAMSLSVIFPLAVLFNEAPFEVLTLSILSSIPFAILAFVSSKSFQGGKQDVD